MAEADVLRLATEHGPWVALVFFLLWRELKKDEITRAVLDRNATVLMELAVIIRERLPRGDA